MNCNDAWTKVDSRNEWLYGYSTVVECHSVKDNYVYSSS